MAKPPSTTTPKAWGRPLARLDQVWTTVEQHLAVWVLVVEIVALTAWVTLKGLSTSHAVSGSAIGILVRGAIGAIVLGLVAHRFSRPKAGAPDKASHPIIVSAAIVLGLLAAFLWAEVGVAWCSNLVAWLLNASTLSLIGGPRGMVTRLTLWLALLGASLAASRGKHISIDVATRYMPARLVLPTAVIGWVAAALVCFFAAWGFVDSIAVTKFRADVFRECHPHEASESGLCETAASERMAVALKGMRRDFFLLRRQVTLDLKTVPRVLAGTGYDSYLSGAAWNDWVREGGFDAHYREDEILSILAPADDPTVLKMPAVVEPGTGEGRDLLIRDLNFVLPFGLLMIGLKMLLRALRAISGEVRVDPDAVHDEEGLSHAHDHDREIAAMETK